MVPEVELGLASSLGRWVGSSPSLRWRHREAKKVLHAALLPGRVRPPTKADCGSFEAVNDCLPAAPAWR